MERACQDIDEYRLIGEVLDVGCYALIDEQLLEGEECGVAEVKIT